MNYYIQPVELDDETDYFQYGQSTTTNFYRKGNDSLQTHASTWNSFPTKDEPNKHYKFASVAIYFNGELVQISRSTYSILDWLGDCGGLYGILLIIGEVIAQPFSTFALQSNLSWFRKGKLAFNCFLALAFNTSPKGSVFIVFRLGIYYFIFFLKISKYTLNN